MTNNETILLESDAGYILRKGKGHFEVYKHGIAHATRVATIEFQEDEEKALILAQDKFLKLPTPKEKRKFYAYEIRAAENHLFKNRKTRFSKWARFCKEYGV